MSKRLTTYKKKSNHKKRIRLIFKKTRQIEKSINEKYNFQVKNSKYRLTIT